MAAGLAVAVASNVAAWTMRPWEEGEVVESEAEVALKEAVVGVVLWRIPSSCYR